MITVSVLGVVEVLHDGRPTPVRPGKTAEVLVRLALDAGTLVATDRLIEDLWADEAVGTARNTLQTKVSRLRRELGDADLVTGTHAGYTLNVQANAVDALEVLRLAVDGATHRAAGEDAAALDTCTAGLTLFRGDVLAGAGDGEWVLPYRVRLEEARLRLLEDRAAACVELGSLGEAIGELEALVQQHPTRESLWALLMLALYRDGRQADALATYTQARRLLAQELGLEPGPALQAMEQRVLLQDPGLDRAIGDSRMRPGKRLPGNLPSLTGSLVGRQLDVAAVVGHVASARLVTIVGTAGVGKTRLAIEVARQLRRGDGTWIVRLDRARDLDSVLRAVAAALDLPNAAESDIVAYLRSSDMLVLLDNCEQVIEDVGPLVGRLLDTAPDLSVLCTSQLPLGVDGEQVHALEPLGPDDSVKLFTERAVRQRPSFQRDSEAAERIVDVCRALDGLPLAIELAAARAKTLSVGEIAIRLGDRFTLLADPGSRRPKRLRTLGAAIGWSYDLLFPDDQRGLWALAAFSGDAGLPAVEHVLLALGVPGASAVDVVGRLVDRSLVSVDVGAGGARYRLLDSIRAFAADRMREADCADLAHRAHAGWFADLAAAAADGARDSEQARHLSQTRGEQANIDAALTWSVEHEPMLALRIAAGFGWSWFLLGDRPLGTERLRRALDAAAGVSTAADRAAALCTLAWLENHDVRAASADARDALRLATDLGDDHLCANSRSALAFVLLQQARPRDALAALEEAIPVLRRLDRTWDEGAAWVLTVHASLLIGDIARAAAACEEAEQLLRALGDDWALGHLDGALGFLAQTERRYHAAATHLRQAAEASGRLGFRASEGLHLATLGRILQQAGSPAAAVDALTQAVDIGREVKDLRVVALARARLARVLRAEGDVAGATAAAQAADHWFRSSGGGEGAPLAGLLVAALAAETDGSRDGLTAVLEDARNRADHEIELLALDALARASVVDGSPGRARELLAEADAILPVAAHLIDENDRLDAQEARRALAISP